MNTTQAREISLQEILQKLGYEPIRMNDKEQWYLSPFRNEKTASFKLSLKLNRWYDHGEQIGGNTVDFVVRKYGYTVKETLKYLEDFASQPFFSFQKQNVVIPEVKYKEDDNRLLKIKGVEHIALKQYLAGRAISNPLVQNHIKEVHYQVNQKNYFAIGFKNRSGGWELRSKYAKICIGKKDITLIDNQSTVLRIFEGFFDYLSFLQMRNQKIEHESDYMVLNSVALIVKNISILKKYKAIELYLDNDDTGEKYTKLITVQFPEAKDAKFTYAECNDLNEYLCKYYPIKKSKISISTQSRGLR